MTRAKASAVLPRKSARTSDVTRPRTLALSAAGAVLGVVIPLGAGETATSTPRVVARPHAKLACASCHTESATAPPTSTCTNCHGGSHASTRPAHRKLAAKGEMSCASCHQQHEGAQGVTFDGVHAIRWGAGVEAQAGAAAIAKGTTVPLVPLAACAKCHDPTRPSDPVSACVPRTNGSLATTASQCFDEHVAVDPSHASARARAAVCASQHYDSRFAAWDAARTVAATTSWMAVPRKGDIPWLPAAGALAGGVLLALGSTALERRKRRDEAVPTKAPAVPAERKRLPVIDTATCLGCYACVDACPFDVLAIERYVAVVARPEECCGVVLCEQVCPNGSLRVRDGDPITDRPAIDEHLESRDVPGLYLAGDLTGLPLIKNAINQGVRVIDRIEAALPRRRAEPIDVVVIGAGPAGLSAALRAKERGLSCVVLEQATVAASIKSFPRDKIVHDPPLDLPLEGELWLKEATKEELLAQWTRIVRARDLDVREGHRVVDIVKSRAGFVVTTEGNETAELRASRVVVAIGRRGTPRTLDLEIEPGAEDRIAYALADARSFEGKRVVIAGLGDSAMEAAVALARQPGTSVTMSYRGSDFSRGKAKNVEEVRSLVAQRKVKLLFETVPVAVTRTAITLAGTGPAGGRRTVNADALLVLVGGVPAWGLLTRAGLVRPPTDPSATEHVQRKTP